jgi:glycosyltransferase involved in cell wall biosynthesis
MTMALSNRRVLYISYNGMLEPLGQSQVIPYLRELSKLGVRFTLLSFERDAAFTPDGALLRGELHRQLAGEGIEWHYLLYHRKPSLPATIYDVVNGVRYARKLVRQNRIEMVHARSHIAATIAMALKKHSPLKMIFDVRGLMADDYVDANHWREGGIPYRLTKTMERRALQASDGVVTLTERVWPVIKDWEGLRDREVIHEVIPCCADLELFRFSEEERAQAKERLNLQDRFVLVYSGSVGGWYLADKMADFFVELARMRPNSHFLWLTGGPGSLIEKLMSERGLNADQFTVCDVRPLDVPMYLAAADVGIAFYKSALSRLATSPVKLAEYLACGLPVVINAGVGDSDTLISAERVGAVVQCFDETEYREVLSTIEVMMCTEARQRARKVAEQFFDVRRVGVERYARLYERLLDRAN